MNDVIPGPWFAPTPPPPYYAVIFTTVQVDDPVELRDYQATAERMEQLAARQPGYLGVEAARAEIGITVSYWADEESIAAWKSHAEHTLARETGRQRWYDRYVLRVARVERDYAWRRP